jgi:hypothetical protein
MTREQIADVEALQDLASWECDFTGSHIHPVLDPEADPQCRACSGTGWRVNAAGDDTERCPCTN